MDLFECIVNRRTTNTKFLPDDVPVHEVEHLIKLASHSPSHFNSQPWRFIAVNDKEIISRIGKIAGDSMTKLMDEGTFWKRYRKYFRFSLDEIEATRDGIYIDKLPGFLKPFSRQIFSEAGGKVISKFKVSKILGSDEEELVATSPLLIAIMLDKSEYIKNELSGFYSVISLGAVVQTLWLSTTAKKMGMQFVSTPGEFPDKWNECSELLDVPDEFELAALFRIGYVDSSIPRPTIDWTSSQRKSVNDLLSYNKWKK